MKDSINKNIMFAILLGFILILGSCVYEDIRDADYLDQKIYMPAANSVIYDVSSVQSLHPEHPSSGAPYRFQIDESSNEFIIPLSVYRSGADNNGTFSVMVIVDVDTVATLIDEGAFGPFSNGSDVSLLAQDEYSLPASVTVTGGEDHERFLLLVDLEFLRANRGESYALGISVASDQREVNPDLNTTIVFIPAGISD